MHKVYSIILAFSIVGLIFSCKSKKAEVSEDAPATDVQTPVTVTSVSNQTLTDYTELNATSSFLQDNIVKSNINGYIQSVDVKFGQYANTGAHLFTIKTKEAKALGNTINKLDPSFHFSGIVHITAPQSGYITQLIHQVGDYVQDGEQLAVISDAKSFGFILNVPYELRQFVNPGKSVNVILPDATHLNGIVASVMPSIDSVSQTQRVLIKVNQQQKIPENLIAKVQIIKSSKTAAVLPKAAVLTDEAQTSFWVMKMIDSVTAVKVNIMKGMESNDKVEILRPQFSPTDKILLSGNYGLGDTAKVKIMKSAE
jgi:multidrug efflux pump subunit AcrA (membrane-fusion protein)